MDGILIAGLVMGCILLVGSLVCMLERTEQTLALLTDKREAYNPAAADFAEVVGDG